MKIFTALLSVALLGLSAPASAQKVGDCDALPDHAALKTALTAARKASNGGLNLDMWGTIVDRAGRVCAVAYTGEHAGAQWPGSRLISAQKANTANAFSLDGLALSTANLFSAVQPGASLYGLQHSNPVNVNVAYNENGNLGNFGTPQDPLTGKLIGGVNVFGGGLALYNQAGHVTGALGVSGDTSCADHNIAWRTRHALALDYVPAGVSADENDQIIFDIENAKSAGGFGHPACGEGVAEIASSLPKTRAGNVGAGE